jgi:hypothetical protein
MFTQEVTNGFDMIGRTAACELPAQSAGCRGFVGVYPPSLDKRIPRWRVRRFEIPEALVDQYFGEEELINSELVNLDSLEAVEALLSNWGVDTAAFQAPWRSDYPLWPDATVMAKNWHREVSQTKPDRTF